ncbi:MAG: helix-turn-helix domain-containing protein [Paenibacillaceae bacterium]|nr:helix-turn-helix domain-containing protein [Paenibacillaceae bacterium]
MFAKRSAHYFNKLFIRITFTTALLVSVLTVFLYLNFKSYSLELLAKANGQLMSQTFENAMQLSSSAVHYTSAFYNHPAAIELMLKESVPEVNAASDLRVLDQALTAAPLLYSAYLYNGTTHTMYQIGDNVITRPSASFYDRDALPLIERQDANAPIAPIPRNLPASELNPQPVRVFSYIVKDSFPEGDTRSALVINVKVESIFNTLLSDARLEPDAHTALIVLDANGRVVAGSDDRLFLTNQAGTPYIAKALRTSDNGGYFFTREPGEQSVVTFSGNVDSGWKMVGVTPYRTISGPINKVKAITVLIGSVMLLVCLVSAFLLARHLYRPIDRLRSTVGRLTGTAAPTDGPDEFETISRSFLAAHDKLLQLGQFRKSNLQALKMNLLAGILKRNVPADCKQLFADYSIALEPDASLTLVLFRIDHYRSQFCAKYDEHDQTLMKYALMNIAEEIAGSGACVDMGGDHIVLLYGRSETPQSDSEWEERALWGEIQRSFIDYCAVSVSVFVTAAAAGIREASALYEEALSLSQYRLQYGHGCLLYASALDRNERRLHKLDSALLAKLSESILKGQYEDMTAVYGELAMPLREVSCNDALVTVSAIAVAIFQSLSSIEKHASTAFELDFASFDGHVKSLETLGDMHDEFDRLFRFIEGRRHQRKDEHKASVIQSAQAYIRRYYKDKSLSSGMVADHVNMSTAYLGKLFREHLSLSIADDLTAVRLERACELLRGTSATIDEILIEIGWENKKYFFTVFKKTLGSTPTEYRLKTNVANEASQI